MALFLRPLGALLVFTLLLGGGACQQNKSASRDDQSPPAASGNGSPGEIVVRETSDNLLLTWIDEQGDFHVVQKPTDVPPSGRSTVRVVDLSRRDGTSEFVYVADLSQTEPGGTYRVRSMPRKEWDELGAARRKVRLEAMGLKPEASATPADVSPPPALSSSASLPGEIVAVIYGADWCKPCHDAEKHLKKAGVLVVKKDIEEDPKARQEMQAKLTRANRTGASIPIIDVMGQILVGFSARALDAAVANARQSQPH